VLVAEERAPEVEALPNWLYDEPDEDDLAFETAAVPTPLVEEAVRSELELELLLLEEDELV
jgi:hypothetical protein